MAVLAANRPHLAPKLTRISGEYFLQLDAVVRNWIVAKVANAPSTGKTIK